MHFIKTQYEKDRQDQRQAETKDYFTDNFNT